MAKEEKVEDLGIPAAPDLDKAPEGISQEDWDDLSQTEKEGVSDTSNEEDDEPGNDLTAEQLAEIAKGDEPPPETPPAKTPEELATEAAAKAAADPAAAEAAKAAPSEAPAEDLLSFKATVADSELPPIDAVPDELQDKLDELDEKYEAEEITLAEYNKERDAINRGIVMQNIQARDAAKAAVVWEKEQSYFLKSRPMYLDKSLKGSALFGALGEAVKALGADPKYANATGIELLVAADKAVKEAFGMTEAPPAKPAEKKEEKPAAPLPGHQTLGDIPPAAANSTDGAWAGLDKLSGQAYEDALEKLSPEVRDRYLNSR
jgi:hypothetical protein